MNVHRLPEMMVLATIGIQLVPGATLSGKFDSKANRIRKVCVLPVEARLTKAGMKGAESMTKESDAWAAKLSQTITEAIVADGAEVAGEFPPESLESDETLRQIVLRVKQKYSTVATQMEKKPGGVKKGRYTLGDEVALLPCANRADSLAFVHASGTVASTGRKVFAVALAGMASPLMWARSDLWITLVDARTGDVIAISRIHSARETITHGPDHRYTATIEKELIKMGVGQAARNPQPKSSP